MEALDADLDRVAISECGTMKALIELFVYRKQLLATRSPTCLDLRISGARHAECDLKEIHRHKGGQNAQDYLSYLDAHAGLEFGLTQDFNSMKSAPIR